MRSALRLTLRVNWECEVRRGALVGVLLCVTLTACGKEKEAPAPPVKQAAPAEPAEKESSGTGTGTGTGEECNPGEKQTGGGCDMDGIIATVRGITGVGGPVQECYVRHVSPPRQGKLVLKFSLTPEGRAEAFQTAGDEFKSPRFVSCLAEALAGLSYPPPGDVPCQVVYPFSFYPEVKRGSR